MKLKTVEYLNCPHCQKSLRCDHKEPEISFGKVYCSHCGHEFPILAGVLILVDNVKDYIEEHIKGIARHVREDQVPKKYRNTFLKAKKYIQTEHIEEDLEAERVTSLYVMNHYLTSNEVSSPSPEIDALIKKYWDHGPFEKIKTLLKAKKNLNLIELGCGVGGLYRNLNANLNFYLGLDSSFASILIARNINSSLEKNINKKYLFPADLLHGSVSREHYLNFKSNGNAEFVVCDLSAPPVKEDYWDISVGLNIIDMLPDPEALPKLQNALLKKGGLAIQCSPYIWHPHVAEALKQASPKDCKTSAKSVEWLYKSNGFRLGETDEHVPWLFFKNDRQLEIYSTHLFCAFKNGPS